MIISKLMHKYALVRDKKPVSWSVGQFFFTPLQMSCHLIHHIRKRCWHQCAGMGKYRPEGNMSLPGFHNIETVGAKFAELINDGKNHQGEFIELYPIVKED